ncbi:MAG: DUF4388 domain-containing protein [Planctomycetes bacterium]|nr:DUF4388 domain-containing protein [Planctomycetota bacterium]
MDGRRTSLDECCAGILDSARALMPRLDAAADAAPDALRRVAEALDELRARIGRALGELPEPGFPELRLREIDALPSLLETRLERLGTDRSAGHEPLPEPLAPGTTPRLPQRADTAVQRTRGSQRGAPAPRSAPPRRDPSRRAARSPAPPPDHPAPPRMELIAPEDLLPVLLRETGARGTLQGTADSLPIAALFDLLANSRQTGRLHLRLPTEAVQLQLYRGLVVGTSIQHALGDRRLGDILVEAGDIDRTTVDTMAREAQASGTPLGALLVETGKLDVARLRDALRQQVQQRFDRVFRAPDAAYLFEQDDDEPCDDRIRSNIRELMLDSSRRANATSRGA